MRNLTKSLVTVSLLAPMAAHSLGIGDIKLHSALNQKIDAEIALSLTASEHIDDIKVTLATPDQFDKLGIAWSYFIAKVKFKPIVKSNGKVVIKMTSDQILQEPILDFLIEVSWPKGDLYKEFTVLVDPPVVYQQSIVDAPVVSPAKQKSISRQVPDTAQQNDFSSLAVEGEYGPTNRNDSLWKVAKKVNQHNDITVEQMMMALYKANPGAFYKKNVNALMQGKALKISEKSDLVKLSKKQAHTQFYRQMAIWEGKAVAEPVLVEIQEPVSEPELQESSDPSSKLTLVSPNEETVTQSTPLTANSAETESLVTENQQLQERLANLEKQFAIMQEMMAIKDQQLAVMQNLHESDAQAAKALNQDSAAVTDEPEEQISSEIKPEKTVETVVPAVEPKQGSNLEQTKSDKTPAAKKLVQTAADKKTVEQESSFNYVYLGAGFWGLLGFAWLFGRKRKTEEEINENSMFSSVSDEANADAQDEITVPVLDDKNSYDVGSVGESSFLSEFTPGDFDVFETDQAEIDPSSETDVYLAYGRYQQAEELMRQAIEDYPEKDEYKLKLLEIFYASENETGFEDYANELVADGKQTDINFWSKASEMGSELIPDSVLFSVDKTEAKFETTDVPVDDYLNASTNIAHDEVKSVADAMTKVDSESDKETLELETNNQSSSQDVDPVKVDDDIESVDFDLSQFESLASADEKESELIEDLETFDFNVDDIDTPSTEVKDVEVEKLAENSDFDFDFDFDEPVAGETTDKINESGVSDLTDMDEFETKIDLAKAYIDMGDMSAAKEIAEEVLAQGSDAQKLEAQTIIDKLG
ncbi:fimbrial protein FimV [Methylococcaceae bacterium CS1]|nr:FimV family protein [Methyloprofundus sp.]TXK98571.1 fimbrial protein FimV [Methylococcaceae bacterium CS4]TXL00546.1 fimbrial protein FimV [Methylococcaceae bacterium CS5]TXL05065.1 fimbrial protein FimV [Methylococcaceae bacterium CS3]TXL07879.1 fimbrial protein FimV [Methylococcaceae bacterium CS1]TXL11504.1 fimbrial protein FimV [Methylococcaceae bacterium CS2]